MTVETPKQLVIDIETLPAKFYGWRTGNTYLSLANMIEPGSTHGVGYQWVGQKTAKYIDARTEGWRKQVFDLIDEADIVIGFNSDGFDLKHLNREFAIARLGEVSPYKTVDLWKVGKKVTGESAKLEWFVSTFLGEHKLSTGGFDLWKRCMDGDEKAHKTMARYCRNDVRVTTLLYEFMRSQGWVKGVHMGLYTGDMDSCPNCASTDRQKRGFVNTDQSIFQRYQCNDCGKWYSSSKSVTRAVTRSR